MSKPDPLIPMSDRPRWETDPLPPNGQELEDVISDELGWVKGCEPDPDRTTWDAANDADWVDLAAANPGFGIRVTRDFIERVERPMLSVEGFLRERLGGKIMDALAAPENRPALVGWLIAEGIAIRTRAAIGTDERNYAHDHYEECDEHGCRPLFLLDGAGDPIMSDDPDLTHTPGTERVHASCCPDCNGDPE